VWFIDNDDNNFVNII